MPCKWLCSVVRLLLSRVMSDNMPHIVTFGVSMRRKNSLQSAERASLTCRCIRMCAPRLAACCPRPPARRRRSPLPIVAAPPLARARSLAPTVLHMREQMDRRRRRRRGRRLISSSFEKIPSFVPSHGPARARAKKCRVCLVNWVSCALQKGALKKRS